MTPTTEVSVVPPSSLFVFWPGEEPPLSEEIRARLSGWGDAAPDADDTPPEGTVWSYWFDLADRPASLLVWCEPVARGSLKLLEQVQWRSNDDYRRAKECKWLVGLEGALSSRQPAADYQFHLRVAEAVGRDWSPVVYDATALKFRCVDEVRQLIQPKTPPRTAGLFSIHRLASSTVRGEPHYWLHTHGLERAGVPDLELYDVPDRYLSAACELFEATAELWIEFGTPPPQQPFSVGRDLNLAWLPWQAVVSGMPAETVGGWDYRRAGPEHTGFRAVLVAESAPKAWVRRRSRPPITVLEKLT
ncbi:MAG: DUF4026 domain-containing protein, partial [Planctomycetia bacterium]